MTSDAKAHDAVKTETVMPADKFKQSNTSTKGVQKTRSYDFMLDYANMPNPVKERISNNKKNNLPANEGVVKNYFVNIPEITNEEMLIRRMKFLNSWKGYVSSRYISGNQVCISISPINKSEELKEILSMEFQKFDFILETYSLK